MYIEKRASTIYVRPEWITTSSLAVLFVYKDISFLWEGNIPVNESRPLPQLRWGGIGRGSCSSFPLLPPSRTIGESYIHGSNHGKNHFIPQRFRRSSEGTSRVIMVSRIAGTDQFPCGRKNIRGYGDPREGMQSCENSLAQFQNIALNDIWPSVDELVKG